MAKTPTKATSSNKKYRNYSKKTLERAIAAVKRGMSKKEASMKYGVPRSTLIFLCQLNRPIDRRPGPDTILTPEEESILQEWIITCNTTNWPNLMNEPKMTNEPNLTSKMYILIQHFNLRNKV